MNWIKILINSIWATMYKHLNLKQLWALAILVTTPLLFCSFAADTLVKIPNGYIAIEKLKIGDLVTSFDFITKQVIVCPITNIQQQTLSNSDNCNGSNKIMLETRIEYNRNNNIDSIAKILVSNHQKFYTSESSWCQANFLTKNNYLNNAANLIKIENISTASYSNLVYYDITVDKTHNFFITHQDILVHNEIITVFGVLLASEKIVEVAIATGTMIYTGISLAKEFISLKRSQKSSNKKRSNLTGPVGDTPPDNNNDHDPDKFKQEHPHGKYEDAPYHRTKQSGRKSPAPKNGQKALDNSVKFSQSCKNRVGISNGQFVKLNFTSAGLYHGYVTQWKDLPKEMRDALVEVNWVNLKGKILCDYLK
jgi:hypothetical protein